MPSGYAPTASLCHPGKWWQHGRTSGIESRPEDAAARSAALRTWLAAEAAARGAESVLLVSHGGMLKQTFAGPTFGFSRPEIPAAFGAGLCCATFSLPFDYAKSQLQKAQAAAKLNAVGAGGGAAAGAGAAAAAPDCGCHA